MASLTDIGTRITQTPGVRGGRPRIAGAGVSVHCIAIWSNMGMTPEEIAAEYAQLTLAQVHAALTYYHANREQMDAEITAEKLEAERLQREHRALRRNP